MLANLPSVVLYRFSASHFHRADQKNTLFFSCYFSMFLVAKAKVQRRQKNTGSCGHRVQPPVVECCFTCGHWTVSVVGGPICRLLFCSRPPRGTPPPGPHNSLRTRLSCPLKSYVLVLFLGGKGGFERQHVCLSNRTKREGLNAITQVSKS